MKTTRSLRHLRYLALNFMHDRAAAAQHAAELGTAVASLNGLLPDDGKAIAFAAAALLVAGCAGMREVSFKALDREISVELQAMGEKP